MLWNSGLQFYTVCDGFDTTNADQNRCEGVCVCLWMPGPNERIDGTQIGTDQWEEVENTKRMSLGPEFAPLYGFSTPSWPKETSIIESLGSPLNLCSKVSTGAAGYPSSDPPQAKGFTAYEVRYKGAAWFAFYNPPDLTLTMKFSLSLVALVACITGPALAVPADLEVPSPSHLLNTT